jgi:hypothetical protein
VRRRQGRGHAHRRDAERFEIEVAGGMFAGRALVLGNVAKRQHQIEASAATNTAS